jgi:hypothetical protein
MVVWTEIVDRFWYKNCDQLCLEQQHVASTSYHDDSTEVTF